MPEENDVNINYDVVGLKSNQVLQVGSDFG